MLLLIFYNRFFMRIIKTEKGSSYHNVARNDYVGLGFKLYCVLINEMLNDKLIENNLRLTKVFALYIFGEPGIYAIKDDNDK